MQDPSVGKPRANELLHALRVERKVGVHCVVLGDAQNARVDSEQQRVNDAQFRKVHDVRAKLAVRLGQRLQHEAVGSQVRRKRFGALPLRRKARQLRSGALSALIAVRLHTCLTRNAHLNVRCK